VGKSSSAILPPPGIVYARRMKSFSAVVLLGLCFFLAVTPTFGGEIQFSIGFGSGWNSSATGGTFNTGANTLCGVGGSCDEFSTFSITDPTTGVTVNGDVSFATTDVSGVTTSALERVSDVTIDNPSISSGWVPVAVVFSSDQFDPTGSELGGVGQSGYFANDSGFGDVQAQAQGRMYYQGLAGSGLDEGVWTSAIPLGPGFDTPMNGGTWFSQSGPVGFFGSIAQTGTLSGQTQLVGMLTAGAAPGSEVVLPGSFLVEIGDDADLQAEVPEPGSFPLVGAGLFLAAAARRRLRGKLSR